jgi:putative cofactor-binding repeat protein
LLGVAVVVLAGCGAGVGQSAANPAADPPPSSAPTIPTASSTAFILGAGGSFTVVASGNPAPTLTMSGALPNGVTFTNNGNGTATIGGTPTGTAGSYAINITAHNGVGSDAAQSFMLTVNAPPAITSVNNAAFSVGGTASFAIAATGYPAPTLSESGLLPNGVTFNASTGVLGGTPASGAGGTYSFTFTAHNGVGSDATQNFTLSVSQVAAISSPGSTTVVDFVVGTTRTFPVTSTGAPTPTLLTGALPTGVTFVDHGDGTGTLGGTPALGTVGSYLITVTAHNGVGPDAAQNFTLSINKAIATVALAGLSQTFDNTPKPASASTTPSGMPVVFSYSGSGGTTYAASSTAPTSAGSYSVSATVSDANYSGSGSGILTVAQATPVITWSAPAAISFGTPLSSMQLDATASVSGSFVYAPAAGAVPSIGSQTLSATFTPTDSIDYTTAAKTVTLSVGQATATVTLGGLAQTYDNTTKSASVATVPPGLDVTLSYTGISGTVYGPSATAPVVAGIYLVSATVSDPNYSGGGSGTLIISKATPAISWATPAAITFGASLSSAQLNATTSVPGSFLYTPAAGAVPSAGSQTLSVIFTPTDLTNYTTATKTVTLSVGQTTPAITWDAPAAISFGTALSSAQLDASASVAGTFVYTPAAGAVLSAGSQALSVTFTPTDSTNYTTATRTVTLSVGQTTPTITWATPAPISFGTAVSSAQLNASASVPGSFVYTPAAGAVLSGGSQILSVTFTPTDLTNYTTATKTVTLSVGQTAPAITWATPAAISFGTALSSAQLDASASVAGSFAYTPAVGVVLSAGSQILSVTFTPTDSTNYATVTKTVTLSVGQTTPTITWDAPAGISYGTALGSTQLDATASVPGTFVYTPAAGAVLSAGSQTLSVTFTPTDTADYTTTTKTVALAVGQTTPTITWVTPAAINFGTALSSAQLNASANMAGTFVYTPAAGAVLSVGSQPLSVTFTPTDSTNYTTATKIVTLSVGQTTPTITWDAPAAISYGTALSSTQLDATASVPGTFVYTPAAGAVLSASSQTLSVTFTPTDSTNYATATKTVTLSVGQTTPTITWATPAAASYGTALSSAQLNATASVAGTFVYTPAAGVVLNAGSQTLSVAFTPTDLTNYTTATKTLTLSVGQTTPAITWDAPAAINFGTALSSAQLNASASVPGIFVYIPAAGVVLNAGSQTLSVNFTPTDTADYTAATKTVTLSVGQTTPSITWATPAGISYGTALGSTQLNATASVPGTFAYTPAAGAVLSAGLQPLLVTFSPTDSTNYSTATKTVTLAVGQAAPTITWATPTAITFGTPLGSGQLNAAASVPGTFLYTPAAGTVLNTGSQTLSVTFTPADTADCTMATGTVTITVNLAPAVTSSKGTTFSVGAAGSFTVTSNGFPMPALSESGNLPSGVTFNSSTGVLAGTPVAGTGGIYPVTFTAHNGVDADATQNFTLTVNQAAAITSRNRTRFTVGTAGTFTIKVAGFPAPVISESGTLPSGVTFDPSTGVLSGTPAVGSTGSYPLVFTADNNVGADATQSFTLTVNQSAAISSANSVIFIAGTMGSFTVIAAGSPAPALSETGALPSGVTFTSSSGLLSGTPALGSNGTYLIAFSAHNGVGADAIQNFTLIVGETAAITSANVVTFNVGALDSFVVAASGAPSPTLSENGALPSGVTFNNSTGILGGIAAAGTDGSYPITFTAHNGIEADATQNFVLTVGHSSTAPVINSATGTTFIVGAEGSFTITFTGSPTPTLSEAGSLPSGVAFDTFSGTLSGTPAVGTGGTYAIIFTAGNGFGVDAKQNFTLSVNSAPAINTEPSSQEVTAGQTATFMVAATGTTPLTYQWQSNGVNISGANSSTYTTPVTTGEDDQTQVSVVVSNPLGSVVSAATLTVNTVPSITGPPTNQTVAVGEEGTFTVSVSVTGNLPLSYRWFVNDVSIPDATSQSYTTPVAAQGDDGKQFRVVVSNSLGTAPSTSATLTIVQAPSPATYYVDFASGLDTNSGITKDAPWQYAPGMNSCAFNCAIIGLQPGDRVIFKGGEKWDASAFPMAVSASGTTGNPIYYGVDQIWFEGDTWSRPVFDLSDATYSEAPVLAESSNFVTFDNLEIENEEVDLSGTWPPRSSIAVDGGSNITIQNCYIHGWSIQNPVAGSDYSPTGGIAFYDGSVGGVVTNCVLDGSPESDSGIGIYGGSSVQGNIIENVPNGIVVTDPAANVSGNQIFDVPYSVDPSVSSNSILAYSSGTISNNIIHDLVEGASAIYLEAGALQLGNTQYVYNNLVWNVGDDSPITVASHEMGPSSTSNQFIYNNTLSGGSTAGCMSVIPSFFAPTNLTVQNNHCISELPASQAWCWNNAVGNFDCGLVTNLTFGNNVLMTTEMAATQGFTLAGSFAPTTARAATVGAGLNLISSCVTIGSPLCSDRLGVARHGGSAAWDAGAYQYQTVTSAIAPSITVQPVRQAVTAGQMATLGVIATGSAPLNYQWQKNGAAISGATSPTYTSPAVEVTDDGSLFTVVISNAVGSVTSSPAILSVNSTPGQLTLDPVNGLSFGPVSVGTASAASVTITNTSGSYVTISNVSVSAPAFDASGVPSGIILAPGQAATLNVVFAPVTTGMAGGNITITSDADGPPTLISLGGMGILPPHSVDLTWDPSTSSVFGYYAYRAQNQYGPYTRLNSTPITTTQYTDISIQPGQTYFYWVTAVDANTLESPFSDPVLAIIPKP